MFTRANFDIQGKPSCRQGTCGIEANYIITNTIIKKGSLNSFVYAYCTKHFNEIEDENTVEVDGS